MFFGGDYLGFDDALFAAARLLEIVSRQPFGLATLLADLPRTFATPEIRVDVPEEEKFALVERAAAHFASRYPVNTIDGVRITFPKGWGLLRASNTQPVLVMRFEATDPAGRWTPTGAKSSSWLAGRASRRGSASVPRARRRLAAAARAHSSSLLFAGRWTAGLLADRWWAAELSPAAAEFLTDWHLLRLTLELAGVPGCLRLVHRPSAAGLSGGRHGADPPQRGQPRVPRGPHAGRAAHGRGRHRRAARASWSGAGWPAGGRGRARLAGRDLRRQRSAAAARPRALRRPAPALARPHGFCVPAGPAGARRWSSALYMLVGAIRWIDGRPRSTITPAPTSAGCSRPRARTRCGATCSSRYELVAGSADLLDQARLAGQTLRGPGARGRGARDGAAQRRLGGSRRATRSRWPDGSCCRSRRWWGTGWCRRRWAARASPLIDRRTMEQFERLAYGLEGWPASRRPVPSQATAPAVPSLWSRPIASRLLAGDSVGARVARSGAADRRRAAPAGLARYARCFRAAGSSCPPMADDRTGPDGEPLFYRLQDSVPIAVGCRRCSTCGTRAFHARSPRYRLGPGRGRGRRRSTPGPGGWCSPGRCRRGAARAARRRKPGRLAPLADGAAGPAGAVRRVGRADGAGHRWRADLARRRLPRLRGLSAVPSVDLARPPGGAVRAASLGTVIGADRRDPDLSCSPAPDALAEAWAAHRRRRRGAGPRSPRRCCGPRRIPSELFRVQARQLERSSLEARVRWAAAPAAEAAELPRAETGWADDTTGPLLAIAFERPGERRLSAVLIGSHDEDDDALRLVRLDSATALPSRSALENRWARLPVVRRAERLDPRRRRPARARARSGSTSSPAASVAYQSHFASRRRRPAGAGLGQRARPATGWAPAVRSRRLEQPARRHRARIAGPGAGDPARRGAALAAPGRLARCAPVIGTAFGRAWNGLRRVLGLPLGFGRAVSLLARGARD